MKKVEHLNRCNHRNRPLRIDSGCAACEIESLREERRNLSRKNRELMMLSDYVNQVREYCQSAKVGRLGDVATTALIKDHKRLTHEFKALKSQYRNYRDSIRAHLEETHASSVPSELVTNDILSRLRSIQNDCAQYAAGSDLIREAADEIERVSLSLAAVLEAVNDLRNAPRQTGHQLNHPDPKAERDAWKKLNTVCNQASFGVLVSHDVDCEVQP